MIELRDILHYHGFLGLGGGAKGFNRGRAEVGNLHARFRCIGGFDVDAAACRDFARLAGVPATCLDLFDREQYVAFHGHQPPAGWREATPEDIRRSAGYERPHIVFLSPPCKGFSGLLSESRSQGAKYQALNRLTLRGIWLMLEAWADDPPELVIFENVPRIQTRGRQLLDQIGALLRQYGYAVAETTHDCGEIGGLAQSRKRFLLVARHIEKVPPFLYQPEKRPLRAVGEILGRMPLPGDPLGGPMHRIPELQWKTWVRLAFVEAGSDWRSLNKLRVVDGKLADYLIVPDTLWQGAGRLGVTAWAEPSGTIAGASRPENGSFSVADPRYEGHAFGQWGVREWDEPAATVTAQSSPGQGPISIADPRLKTSANARQNIYRIVPFYEAAKAITGAAHVAGGAACVADPRIDSAHKNVFTVTRWDEARGTVVSGHSPSNGSGAVADPRPPDRRLFRKYHVTPWSESTGTVIGGHHSEEGAYSVADPRPPVGQFGKKYKVTDFDSSANTVIGGSTTGQGAFAVADPRPNLQRDKGDDYLTAGHYGVVPWTEPSGVISGSAGHDSGRFSVADPRLPDGTQKLVCIIRALDGTWHRPFTTLELAALQSLVDPEECWGEMPFDLDGNSDSAKRERIGNAVPPGAAEIIAGVMGEALLLAWSGERFQLSSRPIWVRPLAIALSVKTPEGQL